jgi:hypothetical protein
MNIFIYLEGRNEQKEDLGINGKASLTSETWIGFQSTQNVWKGKRMKKVEE